LLNIKEFTSCKVKDTASDFKHIVVANDHDSLVWVGCAIFRFGVPEKEK